MKLTETKLKQMILNEMNTNPIDPTAEKLAQKFLESGDSGPYVRQVYELAVTLGYAPEKGYLESLGDADGRIIEFIASPDLAQAMKHVMSGNETLKVFPIEERGIKFRKRSKGGGVESVELPGTYIVTYIARP